MEEHEAVYEAILAVMRGGEEACVLTVIEARGSTPREVGAKLLLRADGSTVGTIGGGPMEAAAMAGKGKVSFTGNLGDIMQESVQAAVGFLRSHAQELRMDHVKWDEMDLHVHVPEGATPKDGPSAGVGLAVAICSAILKVPVRTDMAVTGEITLRGAVLPVGGIREKCLAAKRNRIREMILPFANRADVEDMPDWARKGLTFHFISSAEEAFRLLIKGDG